MTVFFDTSILVYAQQTCPKGEIAKRLLADGGVISVQILNEFASVSWRKLGKSWSDISEAVDDVLSIVDVTIPLTIETHNSARLLADTHSLSFYDALIIAAALEAGCSTLYSDDLQSGRVFGEFRITNPFASE